MKAKWLVIFLLLVGCGSEVNVPPGDDTIPKDETPKKTTGTTNTDEDTSLPDCAPGVFVNCVPTATPTPSATPPSTPTPTPTVTPTPTPPPATATPTISPTPTPTPTAVPTPTPALPPSGAFADWIKNIDLKTPLGAKNIKDLGPLIQPWELIPPHWDMINNLIKNSPSWWQPKPNTTWHIQFQGDLDLERKVAMYDIDLWDYKIEEIAYLKNRGVKVICYFSAGSWEDWRPDAGDFPESVKGLSNGWEGELYLDISKLDILGPIMTKRMDLAVQKGCDGIDPDNVSGYDDATGFVLNYQDQITYNRFLAEEAHKRNLAVGLKNDLEQIKDLLPYFDFAINEQCFEYHECDVLSDFIEANKAVFGIEYNTPNEQFCPQANAMSFSFTKKVSGEMDAWSQDCF